MRGPHKPKRWPWAWLGASALLLGASLAALRYGPKPSPADPELTQLRAGAAALREYGDDALAKLRKEAAAHPVATWRATELEKLVSALPGWRGEWKERGATSRTVQLISAEADAETDVAFLRALTRLPGAVLQTAEWTASGSGTRRTLHTSLTLRFATTSPSKTKEPKP